MGNKAPTGADLKDAFGGVIESNVEDGNVVHAMARAQGNGINSWSLRPDWLARLLP